MYLKRLICAGVATMGVAATAGVATASASTISESGSSLVYPLVAKWSAVYHTNTVKAAAGGSSAGISSIQTAGSSANTIGASDAPMTSTQYSGGTNAGKYVEIPWALSATDVVYNIPGVSNGLKLTGSILAQIYTGKITSWSNAAIVKLNPKYTAALKKAPKITPVFRSDGSGDSFVFQNFLTKSAPKQWVLNGSAPAVSTTFPGIVGQGENGNYGISGEVSKNAGAIGYVSAYYAISQHGIRQAALQNAAGNFELANGATIQNAAKSNSAIPAQGDAFTSALGVQIQYPSKAYKTAYPISTYTYAIVLSKGEQSPGDLQNFLTWATTTGQKYGSALVFYPLPQGIVSADAGLINSIS